MTSRFRRALLGSAAGLAGAFAMRVCVKLWEQASEARAEDGAFGLDPEADRNGARLAWVLVSNVSLGDKQAEQLGTALHYALGAAGGAVYSFLPKQFRAGFGTAYGGLVWLTADLGSVSLSGICDPRSRTIASHSVAFGSHLLYGAVTEALLRVYRS